MEDQEQLTEVMDTSRIRFCGNPAVIREEVKQLFLLAGPLVLTQVMSYSLNFISSAFGGHLGKYELGAISLATSVISVTGVAVGTGLSMACDTLISQLYGSRKLKRIGVVLQRAILILMVFCCPCWALFINTEKILLAAKQDPEVARLCQLYVTIFIPALTLFLYQIQVRYLQNQGIIMPQVLTGMVANVLSVIMNYSFLIVLKLGVVGSACANLICQYCQTIMLLVYIRWRRLHVNTWGGWTSDCLQDWGCFLRLAIPSMIMFCIEFWAYEIGSFLAGLIDQVQLGAQVVIFQFLTILFMIHVGIGMAAGVRVGMALGAGCPQQAKTSAMTALVCTGCVALVLMTLLLMLKDVIPKIFTSNRQIIELVSSTIPIVAPFHLCDAIGSGVASGIVRGIGMQKVGAIANLVAFYIVGIPVGIALMFAAKIGILVQILQQPDKLLDRGQCPVPAMASKCPVEHGWAPSVGHLRVMEMNRSPLTKTGQASARPGSDYLLLLPRTTFTNRAPVVSSRPLGGVGHQYLPVVRFLLDVDLQDGLGRSGERGKRWFTPL
ncbi:multidrug and toxin extrusion protein 2-like [Rhinoraja longicauda]